MLVKPVDGLVDGLVDGGSIKSTFKKTAFVEVFGGGLSFEVQRPVTASSGDLWINKVVCKQRWSIIFI